MSNISFFWSTGHRVTNNTQFMGWGDIETDENAGQIVTPIQGGLTNLFVQTAATCTSTSFTIRVNGVDTALVVTLTASSSGNNTTDVAAVNPGDLISVGIISSADDQVPATVSVFMIPPS